jgi:L-asparaginase
MKILFVTTGGTIDKVYFDAKSDYEVGSPQVREVLADAHVSFDFDVVSVLHKDSLEMTEEDRLLVRKAVEESDTPLVVVTHGTDTMIQTALVLGGIPGKTIVLTGSMQPARFRESDATFNIGAAIAAVQSLPPGVHIAMNGRIFDPRRARKNVEENRFEETG